MLFSVIRMAINSWTIKSQHLKNSYPIKKFGSRLHWFQEKICLIQIYLEFKALN